MSKHSPKYDIYFLGKIEDPKIYDCPSFSELASYMKYIRKLFHYKNFEIFFCSFFNDKKT
jgi:hypothetical protein